jgi:hypothetical protein
VVSILQLHTVKERSELDIVVPRPLHELEYYESTKTANSITEQFAQSLLNLKDEVRLDFTHYVTNFLRLVFYWT